MWVRLCRHRCADRVRIYEAMEERRPHLWDDSWVEPVASRGRCVCRVYRCEGRRPDQNPGGWELFSGSNLGTRHGIRRCSCPGQAVKKATSMTTVPLENKCSCTAGLQVRLRGTTLCDNDVNADLLFQLRVLWESSSSESTSPCNEAHAYEPLF